MNDSDANHHKLIFKNAGKNADEMRRRRVEGQVQLRKNKRDETLLKKRSINVDSPEQDSLASPNSKNKQPTDLPSIETIVMNINNTDHDTRLKMVQSARKLLSGSRNPPIDHLIQGGIIPSLVNCLESESPELQFEAAWALTNIASGNSTQTAIVANSGAIEHFLRLLSSPHQNVCEQSVWALGNIVGDGPHFRDRLISLGIIKPLLHLINSKIPIAFLRNLTWVIVNLCRHKDPPTPIEAVKELLPALLYLLTNKDTNVIVDTIWAISYITDSGSDQIDLVINANVVPYLTPFLNHECFKAQTAALRALGNIITGSDKQTQVVLDAGALSYFPTLLHTGKDKIHKEAVWFISNITAGNTQQIQEVINYNLMTSIVQHLKTSDFNIQKEASWAICNLIINGTHEQIKYLLTTNFIDPLCKMLKGHDTHMIQVVLDGILNLLKKAEDLLPSITNALEECGAVDSIEQLQAHQNTDVYKLTYEIIETFFRDESNDAENNLFSEMGNNEPIPQNYGAGQNGEEIQFVSSNTSQKFEF